MQERLARVIVSALELRLTEDEDRRLAERPIPDVRAYECYLRANQLVMTGDLQSMTLARDLYRRCVDDDAGYAPAWGCLGRVYRFLAKYGIDQADNFAAADGAFKKAFRLNSELALAHNFYTLLETDLG